MSESAPTFKWVAVQGGPDDALGTVMCFACQGPQNGEPYCPCEMVNRGVKMVRMEDHPRRPPLDQIAIDGSYE